LWNQAGGFLKFKKGLIQNEGGILGIIWRHALLRLLQLQTTGEGSVGCL
jgi:hypothetical protein